MRANRGADTKPETAVRSALHRSGLRFRKGLAIRAGDVRVRPDIVFTRARVAIFIDGCFWHACPQHGTQPRRNSGYWSAKLQRNLDRDRRVDAALAANGWQVLRFWEHEGPSETANAISRAVHAAGPGLSAGTRSAPAELVARRGYLSASH